ncbi:MFS transporter [Arthrobacter burdickii]|uniref:MFS transporter n=1 Tax=Arthrobacter burdickii TaxID=3035920 RepID=A0ABT8K714_9MICC|nr:MFS transporter [Arthrobacter burdickii]MDN4612808.1 MFS transporter [Arthrobacter burdickii]
MKRSLHAAPSTATPLFTVTAVALIAATYGLARFGYGLFLPSFSESFALTPMIAGLLSSGASVTYCISAAFGFRYAPRHPRFTTILAGSTATLGSGGIAAAQGTSSFSIGVLLAGMGAGFASPALVELVQRNVAPAKQNRLQSVVNSGTGFGVVAAGALALQLGASWRAAWILIAVITFTAMVAVLRADISRTEALSGVPRREDVSAHTGGSSIRGLRWPMAAAFVFGVGSAAPWVYGRSLLEDVGGMTTETSATVWMALGAGSAGAVLLAPWLARHSVKITWYVTVSATSAATVAFALAPTLPALSLATAGLFGLAYTAASSVLIIWTSFTAANSAAGTSILFTCLVLGQALGSTVTGALVESTDLIFAFVTAGVLCLFSAFGATTQRTAPAVQQGDAAPSKIESGQYRPQKYR